MSLRLQRISRILEANSSTSLHLRHAARPPDPTSMSLRLQRTRAPYLDVPTPAAHLYTSTSPVPQHAPRAPDLHTSFEVTLAAGLPSFRASYLYVATSARLQRVSIPPYLLISIPTACLQTSRALEANTSTSLRLQRASRAPGLLRQIPPHLRACIAPL